MGDPSASRTAAYFENTAMPGPIIACDKSTGATGERSSPEPLVISSSIVLPENWTGGLDGE
jgi:hypothetical protein